MNLLLHWLTSPEWALVVKALLHSLWQGAVIAAVLAWLLRRIASPTTRYRLALAGLGAIMVAAIVTWGVLSAPKVSEPAITPMDQPVKATAPVANGSMETIVVEANWTASKPKVQWTAWLALVWLIGASAMLGRASVKVAGAEQLRRGCLPLNDERITGLVAEARRAVKLTRQVRVAVTDKLTSPAVVGVLVPTLILPLSLITTLSHEQIRFILLHELAHIRRGDYLANLFQLFAEALLFFNPTVWWLSHQIRSEREACCDALAIELSGAPTDYAQTLVRVAENILTQAPAAAPAFGNQNEPSSLAERVQRLLVPGYRPSPRLTWRAMLATLAVGVVTLTLLAIGTRQTVAAVVGDGDAEAITPATTDTGITETDRMVQDGKLLYELGKIDKAIEKFNAALAADPENLEAKFYLELAQSTSQDKKSTNPIADRLRILEKLQNIQLDHVTFDDVPLGYVLHVLGDESKQNDPDKIGIDFAISDDPQDPRTARVDSVTGLPVVSSSAEILITINPALTNVTLSDALDAVIKGAAQPLKYSIKKGTIAFSRNSNPEPEPLRLYTRTYKVDPTEFARAVGLVGPVQVTNASLKLREILVKAGVDLQPPKTVYYNITQGLIMARATLEELDRIESLVQVVNVKPPQVNIRIKVVEVPEDKMDVIHQLLPAPSGDSPSTRSGPTAQYPKNQTFISQGGSNATPSLSSTLTESQAKKMLKTLEDTPGVEILSAPEVTTLSGRQAQIQILNPMFSASAINPAALQPPGIVLTNGDNLSLYAVKTNSAPTLDVIPYISADGFAILIEATLTITAFVGYDAPTNLVTVYTNGVSSKIGEPLPHFRHHKLTSAATVGNGQTMVIGEVDTSVVARQASGSMAQRRDPQAQESRLFMFLTPTILDAAGNPVQPKKDTRTIDRDVPSPMPKEW